MYFYSCTSKVLKDWDLTVDHKVSNPKSCVLHVSSSMYPSNGYIISFYEICSKIYMLSIFQYMNSCTILMTKENK